MWEYLVQQIRTRDYDMGEILNDHGRHGWELVSYERLSLDATEIVMKKIKTSPANKAAVIDPYSL